MICLKWLKNNMFERFDMTELLITAGYVVVVSALIMTIIRLVRIKKNKDEFDGWI